MVSVDDTPHVISTQSNSKQRRQLTSAPSLIERKPAALLVRACDSRVPLTPAFRRSDHATYELIDPNTGKAWRAPKRGFCMIDIARYKPYTGQASNQPRFTQCGLIGVPGNQGVSKGWTDIYEWKLAGQFFVLDGGDGQAPVPPGTYVVRVTVNPGYVPAKGEICRHADPNRKGVCHALPESNYEKNVGEATVTIPEHPGRSGVGPLKDQPSVTKDYLKGEQEHNH